MKHSVGLHVTHIINIHDVCAHSYIHDVNLHKQSVQRALGSKEQTQ